MSKIKLFNTFNKVKHILVRPKLRVMFSRMSRQPFYMPPFSFDLFTKHRYLNRETFEYEYGPQFIAKMQKWFPFFPVKSIRITLPDWMTFRVINNDFSRKWKYDNPRFERRGNFSIVIFGFALTFYLEIPLDNEDKYHEDEYYEFMMEYLSGVDAGDLKECIKQMGTMTQHTKKYGERKYHGFWKEWLRPEWHTVYDIAVSELDNIYNHGKDVEWILCSAIKRNERRNCDNPYHEGTNDLINIELGYRHHDIIWRFGEELEDGPYAQGFYTSKGRFVGREEAAKIAYAAGQIKSQKSRLFSEDLY